MRHWVAGDPPPEDHPVVVDDDSMVWAWEEVDVDLFRYVQQGVTINGNGGEGPREYTWTELLEEFGPVYESEREL